jgi:hypothetical protein
MAEEQITVFNKVYLVKKWLAKSIHDDDEYVGA